MTDTEKLNRRGIETAVALLTAVSFLFIFYFFSNIKNYLINPYWAVILKIMWDSVIALVAIRLVKGYEKLKRAVRHLVLIFLLSTFLILCVNVLGFDAGIMFVFSAVVLLAAAAVSFYKESLGTVKETKKSLLKVAGIFFGELIYLFLFTVCVVHDPQILLSSIVVLNFMAIFILTAVIFCTEIKIKVLSIITMLALAVMFIILGYVILLSTTDLLYQMPIQIAETVLTVILFLCCPYILKKRLNANTVKEKYESAIAEGTGKEKSQVSGRLNFFKSFNSGAVINGGDADNVKRSGIEYAVLFLSIVSFLFVFYFLTSLKSSLIEPYWLAILKIMLDSMLALIAINLIKGYGKLKRAVRHLAGMFLLSTFYVLGVNVSGIDELSLQIIMIIGLLFVALVSLYIEVLASVKKTKGGIILRILGILLGEIGYFIIFSFIVAADPQVFLSSIVVVNFITVMILTTIIFCKEIKSKILSNLSSAALVVMVFILGYAILQDTTNPFYQMPLQIAETVLIALLFLYCPYILKKREKEKEKAEKYQSAVWEDKERAKRQTAAANTLEQTINNAAKLKLNEEERAKKAERKKKVNAVLVKQLVKNIPAADVEINNYKKLLKEECTIKIDAKKIQTSHINIFIKSAKPFLKAPKNFDA